MPTNIFSQPTEINALFTIGGTDNVAVTSTGSVGIGTTSPGAKLAVNSTGIAATPTISLTNTSSAVFNHTINAFAPNLTAGENNIFIIGKEGNTKNAGYIGYTWNADADNSNVLTFGHWASDNLMNLTGDGKLGIGTTTPSSILSIKTTSTTADTFQIDAGSVRTHLLGAESGNGVIYLRNSSNSNYVRINAGGNSYFNGGNVGIGTTSPSANLDVVSSSGSAIVGKFSTSGTTAYLSLADANTSSFLGLSATTNDLKFWTQNSARVTINSVGNVGIGTDSPAGKLAIKSPGDVDTYGDAFVLERAGTTAKLIRMYEDAADGFLEVRTGANDIVTKLSGYSGTPSYFLSRLGIGTTSPAQLLHIKGTNPILNVETTWATGNYGQIRLGYTAGTDRSITGHYDSGMTFDVNGERMRIDTSGNVGIGTANPSTILTISKPIDSADYGAGTQALDFKIYYPGYDIDTVKASIYVGVSDKGTLNTQGGYLGFMTSNDGTLAERLRIEKNGNVGIGTTSPIQPLTVQADTGASAIALLGRSTANTSRIDFYNNGGTSRLLTIQGSDGANQIYGDTNIPLTISTNATERMRIDGSGNVGIGTTSPSEKLEVNGNIKISSSSEIIFDDNNSVGQSFIKSGGDLNLIIDSNNNQNVAALIVEKDTQTAGDGTELFRVQENGNVGINNTSPTAKLDVDLNSSNSYDSATLTTPVVAVANRNSSNVNNQAAGLHLYATGWAGSTTGIISLNAIQIGGNSSTADFAIQTRNNGTYAEKFRLTAAGNVGIGTTSPAVDLHVRDSNQNSNITDTIPSWWSAIFERSYSTASSAAVGIVGGSQSEGVGGSLFLGYSDDVDNSSIQLVSNTMRFTVNTSEKMRINEDGNVGIGTTSPGANLQVGSPGADLTQDLLLVKGGGSSGNFGFRVQANNSEELFFVDTLSYNVLVRSGNVGIGTTSPQDKLHVSGGNIRLDNGAGDGFIKDSAGNNRFYFGTGTYVNSNTGGPVAFQVAGSEKMRVNYDGNVGIGTTSPSYRLDVVGTTYTSDDLLVGIGNASSWHRVSIHTGGFIAQSGNKGIGVYADATDSNNNLFAYDYDSSSFKPLKIDVSTLNITNGTSSVIYHNGTNVGIGTTSPDAKLKIINSSETNPGLTICNAAGGGDGFNFQRWQYVESSTGYRLDLKQRVTTGVVQYAFDMVNNGTTYNSVLVLDRGNVGIGTTSPAYKLDVSGTIRATGDVIAFSDARVKENVETIPNALDKVKAMRGVGYNKIGEEKRAVGVIAQELLEVLPEAVHQDDEGMYSVAYGNVVGVLIEAMKEQQKQIDELKAQLNGTAS